MTHSSLVMDPIARTGIDGIDGIVIEITAERILGDVRCAVLAVEPNGFVSPIHAPAR